MSKRSRKDKEYEEFFGNLYQLAGDLLLCDPKRGGEDFRTEAEWCRMRELLLDALSMPRYFTAEGLRAKHDLAVKR